MKIQLSQLNYHTGNFEANTKAIIDQINLGKQNGADLVVFSELSLTGYPPRDFLEFEEFISECEDRIKTIAQECIGIAAIVGAPIRNEVSIGKKLFNAALVLQNGEVKAVAKKALLPNYDVFDEYRYFEPNLDLHCVTINGVKIALTICEDLWNEGDTILYPFTPMEKLIQEKPQLMINIAASPFSRHHIEFRKKILQLNVQKYQLPLLYVNHVGAQTELIFDGGSMAIGADGKVLDEMAYFDEEVRLFEWKNNELQPLGEDHSFLPSERIELIHDALVTGVRDYFRKQGFKKAILGSSGGIDSALVQALAVKALGPENVMAVLMPSKYSSDHSVADAITLSNNLGNPWYKISIQEAFDVLHHSLIPFFDGKAEDVTEENMQSRIRGVMLMALSNKHGYILLNTSNKSENAVGYGTLYGDMCGGLSVIGDLYKIQVYELANHINRNKELIPNAIITKAPSAELRPDQKDTDSLPDYEILDPLLHAYIEERKGPKELQEAGFSEELIKRVLKLVNNSEYKRHQTPPILRVSSKAFGMGRRMPIVARYLS